MALLASQKLRIRSWARRMVTMGMRAATRPDTRGEMIQPRLG
jgi:hypothetical protein